MSIEGDVLSCLHTLYEYIFYLGLELRFSCASLTLPLSLPYCLWAVITLVEFLCHPDVTLPAVGGQFFKKKVGSLKKSSYLYSSYRSLWPHRAFPLAAFSTVVYLLQLARLAIIPRLMISIVTCFMVLCFVH